MIPLNKPTKHTPPAGRKIAKNSDSTCAVCGSREQRTVFTGKDCMHGIPGSYAVRECARCGLLYVHPRPSGKALARHYPAGYHAYAPPDLSTRKERLALALYKLYFGESRGFKAGLKRLALLPLKHLLRGSHIHKGARLLDVGCGSGAFIAKMRAAGMRVVGVEPSPDGCKAARKLGLEVHQGFIEDQHFPPASFDVITLNHVFEHMDRPIASMRELARILKPGGRIIMAVPNTKSLARSLFKTYWAQLDVPRHLYNYNVKNLRIAAGKSGLRVAHVRYISFPSQFQASLAYALGRSRRGVALGQSALANNRLLYFLFFPLVYLVDALHIGDVVEVTFMKS